MEDDKIQEVIKKSVLNRLVAQAKNAKKQAPEVLKRERKETRQAFKILVKIIKGHNVTDGEVSFFKAQSSDLAKALGLLTAFLAIPSPILIGLTVFLEKKGVKILPKDNSKHLK